jgi:methylglutaconyl-CoA hydratase
VRAIVLGGSGKAFCAGADLAFMREVGGYTWEQNRATPRPWPRCCGRSTPARCRSIARIHGDCYAGGLGIASVCDIRSVAEGVNFSLSEARLGLLPATISPYVVRPWASRRRGATS